MKIDLKVYPTSVNTINSNHEAHKKIIQTLRFVVCVEEERFKMGII
jgi:hypothetical protein